MLDDDVAHEVRLRRGARLRLDTGLERLEERRDIFLGIAHVDELPGRELILHRHDGD